MIRNALPLLALICLVAGCAKPDTTGNGSGDVAAEDASELQTTANADELKASSANPVPQNASMNASRAQQGKPRPGTDAAIAEEMRVWDEAQQAKQASAYTSVPQSDDPSPSAQQGATP